MPPRLANASIWRSGSTIIRCTSSGTRCRTGERGDDRYSERQVGHEAPIHHVDVNQVGAAGLHLPFTAAAQGREIGGEDRGRNAAASAAP